MNSNMDLNVDICSNEADLLGDEKFADYQFCHESTVAFSPQLVKAEINTGKVKMNKFDWIFRVPPTVPEVSIILNQM